MTTDRNMSQKRRNQRVRQGGEISDRCLLVRNLPRGIPQDDFIAWFTNTFEFPEEDDKANKDHQITRVVYCNHTKSQSPTSAGSYMVEFESSSRRDQTIDVVRRQEKHHESPSSETEVQITEKAPKKWVFGIKIQIERFRSEKVLKKLFQAPTAVDEAPEDSKENNSAPEQENGIPQPPPSSTLSSRCILVRNSSLISNNDTGIAVISQIVEGCLGEKIHRSAEYTLGKRHSKVLELNLEESVDRILEACHSDDPNTTSEENSSKKSGRVLEIPVQIHPVKSENYAKECLGYVAEPSGTTNGRDKSATKDTKIDDSDTRKDSKESNGTNGTPRRSKNSSKNAPREGRKNDETSKELQILKQQNISLWELVEQSKERTFLQEEKINMLSLQISGLEKEIAKLRATNAELESRVYADQSEKESENAPKEAQKEDEDSPSETVQSEKEEENTAEEIGS